MCGGQGVPDDAHRGEACVCVCGGGGGDAAVHACSRCPEGVQRGCWHPTCMQASCQSPIHAPRHTSLHTGSTLLRWCCSYWERWVGLAGLAQAVGGGQRQR